MTRIEITKEMESRRANKALEAWIAENVAGIRSITYVKDVKLGNGKILPNRKLTKLVHDLNDGRSVEIKNEGRIDGVTQNWWSRFVAVEVAL